MLQIRKYLLEKIADGAEETSTVPAPPQQQLNNAQIDYLNAVRAKMNDMRQLSQTGDIHRVMQKDIKGNQLDFDNRGNTLDQHYKYINDLRKNAYYDRISNAKDDAELQQIAIEMANEDIKNDYQRHVNSGSRAPIIKELQQIKGNLKDYGNYEWEDENTYRRNRGQVYGRVPTPTEQARAKKQAKIRSKKFVKRYQDPERARPGTTATWDDVIDEKGNTFRKKHEIDYRDQWENGDHTGNKPVERITYKYTGDPNKYQDNANEVVNRQGRDDMSSQGFNPSTPPPTPSYQPVGQTMRDFRKRPFTTDQWTSFTENKPLRQITDERINRELEQQRKRAIDNIKVYDRFKNTGGSLDGWGGESWDSRQNYRLMQGLKNGKDFSYKYKNKDTGKDEYVNFLPGYRMYQEYVRRKLNRVNPPRQPRPYALYRPKLTDAFYNLDRWSKKITPLYQR